MTDESPCAPRPPTASSRARCWTRWSPRWTQLYALAAGARLAPARRRRTSRRPAGAFLVVYEDGKPVAGGGVKRRRATAWPRSSACTSCPRRARQGLGRRLLEELEEAGARARLRARAARHGRAPAACAGDVRARGLPRRSPTTTATRRRRSGARRPAVTAFVLTLIGAALAVGLELLEALAIVLAVGSTRRWRDAVIGAVGAVVLLAVAVVARRAAAAGAAAARARCKVVIGTALLLFGLEWLRKGVLRLAGRRSPSNSFKEYLEEREALEVRAEPPSSPVARALVAAMVDELRRSTGGRRTRLGRASRRQSSRRRAAALRRAAARTAARARGRRRSSGSTAGVAEIKRMYVRRRLRAAAGSAEALLEALEDVARDARLRASSGSTPGARPAARAGDVRARRLRRDPGLQRQPVRRALLRARSWLGDSRSSLTLIGAALAVGHRAARGDRDRAGGRLDAALPRRADRRRGRGGAARGGGRGASGRCVLARLPLEPLQVVIGTALLLFGLEWLRKGVLRLAGRRAPSTRCRSTSRSARRWRRWRRRPPGQPDWPARIVAGKGVLLEGRRGRADRRGARRRAARARARGGGRRGGRGADARDRLRAAPAAGAAARVAPQVRGRRRAVASASSSARGSASTGRAATRAALRRGACRRLQARSRRSRASRSRPRCARCASSCSARRGAAVGVALTLGAGADARSARRRRGGADAGGFCCSRSRRGARRLVAALAPLAERRCVPPTRPTRAAQPTQPTHADAAHAVDAADARRRSRRSAATAMLERRRRRSPATTARADHAGARSHAGAADDAGARRPRPRCRRRRRCRDHALPRRRRASTATLLDHRRSVPEDSRGRGDVPRMSTPRASDRTPVALNQRALSAALASSPPCALRALARRGAGGVLGRPRGGSRREIDLRDAVAGHRHAVEAVGGLHRALLVGDDDELRAVGEAAQQRRGSGRC